MPIHHIGLCSWSVQPESPESLVAALGAAEMGAVQLAMSPCVQERALWSNVMDHLEQADIAVLSGMMEPVGEDYSTLDAIAKSGGVRQDANWPANETMAKEYCFVRRGAFDRIGDDACGLPSWFIRRSRAGDDLESTCQMRRCLCRARHTGRVRDWPGDGGDVAGCACGTGSSNAGSEL